MATLTLDQKRLSQLRTQLYGKPEKPRKAAKNDNSTETQKENSKSQESDQDQHFVKRDLTKVFFLSAIILFIQLAVHFALVNKWVVINFYGITY